MPDFSYTARDSTGQRVTGVLTAANRRDALAQLDKHALFPLSVEVETSAGGRLRRNTATNGAAAKNGAAQRNGSAPGNGAASRNGAAPSSRPAGPAPRRTGRRIKPQMMAVLYAQMAGLLRSGVPLLRSLKVLKDQTSNAALATVLENIYSQVEDGAALAEAMGRHPKVFSEMAISMVRAGGEGGFLEDALTRVADFTEKQEDMKGRAMGALAYPMFLGVVGTTVVIVLIVFFVPKFETMFGQLRAKGELPAVTECLLWMSHTLGSIWGLLALGVLAAAGFFVWKQVQTEPGKLLRDKIKLRIPVLGGIFLNLAVSRFCRVLGTLLHNGVPILRSLEISSYSAGNRVLSAAIEKAGDNISAGESLAAPLSTSGHFPRNVVEMIAVAEESNTLESVLTDISESLDKQTWRRLDLFVRLLEPMMLLVLAGMVLFVVVALLYPVMKMSMTV